MKVNSHNQEFGYELLSAVPYAYELFLQGKLTETVSGKGSEPLYYFSPKHTINSNARSWFNTAQARRAGLPYTHIHRHEQPDKIFPPYKEVFANEQYKYEKPILCICNRYNVEWNVEPINYFSPEILDWLFENLKEHYEIIYFPVDIPAEIQDNAPPLPLGDVEVAKRHKVTLFTELNAQKGWNETLLRVFANCEHFITMNGGYSILASLFSGTNMVYSKRGKVQTKELRFGSFWRWYGNLNDQRVLHVDSYSKLKEKVKALYIDKLPCLSVLVRTSHRPNYLSNCMKSIESQSYPNINPVLICDNDKAVEYSRKYEVRMLRVQKREPEQRHSDMVNYGKPFPFNCYLEQAQQRVQGFVHMLDDDDIYTDENSVHEIMQKANLEALTIWKTDFKRGKTVPSHSFGKRPTLYDVTGIGFCYHTDHRHLTDWSGWKRADYRTAVKLSENLSTVWIDKTLTALQDRAGHGSKKDLPDATKAPKFMRVKMVFPDGKEKFQFFQITTFEETEKIYNRQGIVCHKLNEYV